MAYFLGRDVNCFITTETTQANKAIGVLANGAVAPVITLGNPSTANTNVFADDMQSGTALSGYSAYADVTGVEVGLGTMDEDTSYIGQIQPGKVEIKKEYTVSLTRKKNNNLWDVIFNGDGTNNARFGMGTGNSGLGTGLVNPKDILDTTSGKSCYGYRVTLQFKTGTAGSNSNEEVLCITNCCITGYTTTLNADGVQEETLEFSSYQPALYGVSGDKLNNTLTATAGF